MSKMIERVARALHEASPWHEILPGGMPKFSSCPEGYKAAAKVMARAAIEAMREPTEAMVDAYYEGCDPGGDLIGTGDGSPLVPAFRRMIDAALSEGGER